MTIHTKGVYYNMLGIIGGTGLTEFVNLQITGRKIVRTPYGEASQPLVFGELVGHNVVFLARHGSGHTIPPHAINYRANIWALQSVGVTDLLAVATVGGITSILNPGDIVLPHQLIDYTYGRKNTYHDGIELPVKHIDFTEPYSAKMRDFCKQAAFNLALPLIDGGVYAVVQGPRLETAAEINRLEHDGATLVGMTGMPEAALARELVMQYAAICPIANHAAGRGSSANGIAYEDIADVLNKAIARVRIMIQEVVTLHAAHSLVKE